MVCCIWVYHEEGIEESKAGGAENRGGHIRMEVGEIVFQQNYLYRIYPLQSL